MPCAQTWLRLGVVVLWGSALAAMELTTTLSIQATANLEGPVEASWQIMERPAGSGIPVMTPRLGEAGRYEAFVQLPEPRVGRYVFQVRLIHEEVPEAVRTVDVQVVARPNAGANPSVSPGGGGGGGGGCGSGGGSGLAIVLLLLALHRGVKPS